MTASLIDVGRRIRRLMTTASLSAAATVMGTGIVSIALRRQGWPVASKVLLWMTVSLWVILAIALLLRLLLRPSEVGAEAALPGSLAAVAGTCVLGSRL